MKGISEVIGVIHVLKEVLGQDRTTVLCVALRGDVAPHRHRKVKRYVTTRLKVQ